MKDSRKGEALWSEWEGYGFHYTFGDGGLVFFTEEHVDVEHEIVRRALASTLQRDGIVDSLAHAFKLIEDSHITQGYAGPVGGDVYLTVCDEDGYTTEGTEADSVIEITYVEVEYP